MGKLTTYPFLDFNSFKLVIWDVNAQLKKYQIDIIPLKGTYLHYKPMKSLCSNCIHGMIEVKETLLLLRACIYQPKINVIPSLLSLERVLDKVIRDVDTFVENVCSEK